MKIYEDRELEALALHITDIYALRQVDIKNPKEFSEYYFKIYNDIFNTLMTKNNENEKIENGDFNKNM